MPRSATFAAVKRITIKDLARQLGVNVSTISRALKGHPDISPDMRRRVQDLAEALHYTPNTMAVGLRKQRSRLVGLVMPEINMFFFPSVIKGVDEVLRQANMKMIVLQSGDTLDQEIENLRICAESGVEGLLLSVSKETVNLHHLSLLEDLGAPVVLFDRVVDTDQYDRVMIDDFKAAVQGVQYLLQTGCRRLVGIFGAPGLQITQRRRDGFLHAWPEAANTPDSVLFAGSPVEGAEAVKKLLQERSEPIDGIFVMSDELMAGVAPTLRQSNLRIPEDCSVIGISDGFLPHYLHPKITYLHHSGYEIGRMAARRLLQLIDTPEHLKAERFLAQTPLVALQSTRP